MSVFVCEAVMYLAVAILFSHASVLGYTPSLENNNERKLVIVELNVSRNFCFQCTWVY